MNWTLLSILLILAVNVLIGIKKGVIKMLFSALAIIVVVIITSIFAPKLSEYLKNNTTWDDSLTSKTESFLMDKGIIKDDVEIDVSELPLPDMIKDKIADGTEDALEQGIQGYNEAVVNKVSGVIFSAIVYIVFFVVAMALTSIICMILDVVSKLPVLNQINKTAGGIIGLVQGLVIVWLFMIIIMIFGNTEFAMTVHKDINRNPILTFLYDKNAIMYFVTKFLL